MGVRAHHSPYYLNWIESLRLIMISTDYNTNEFSIFGKNGAVALAAAFDVAVAAIVL